MNLRSIAALIFVLPSIGALAADPNYYKLADLLATKSVKENLNPDVALYLATQPKPEFAELSRREIYTRSAISLSPFGGSRRHCVEAFERALAAMIRDASNRGYDAIIELQPAVADQPSSDPEGFGCTPGYKTTEVSLTGTFAMSAAALQRASEEEQTSLHSPTRPPADGAIFLPLDAILASPEAIAVLGSNITAHWGENPPAYSLRYGPDEYSEEAEIKTLDREGACKQAVLNALGTMVEEAQARHYDSIIKIRSHLDGKYTPNASDVECALSRKTASVSLQSSLANKKSQQDLTGH